MFNASNTPQSSSDNTPQVFTEKIDIKTLFEKSQNSPLNVPGSQFEFDEGKKQFTFKLIRDRANSSIRKDVERGAILINGEGYSQFQSYLVKQGKIEADDKDDKTWNNQYIDWIKDKLGINDNQAEAIIELASQNFLSFYALATITLQNKSILNILKGEQDEIIFELDCDNFSSKMSIDDDDDWKNDTQLANTFIRTQLKLSEKPDKQYGFLLEDKPTIYSRSKNNLNAVSQVFTSENPKDCLDIKSIDKAHKSTEVINEKPYNLKDVFEKNAKLTNEDLQPVVDALTNRYLVKNEKRTDFGVKGEEFIPLMPNDVVRIHGGLKAIERNCENGSATKAVLAKPIQLAEKILTESKNNDNPLVSPYSHLGEVDKTKTNCLKLINAYITGLGKVTKNSNPQLIEKYNVAQQAKVLLSTDESIVITPKVGKNRLRAKDSKLAFEQLSSLKKYLNDGKREIYKNGKCVPITNADVLKANRHTKGWNIIRNIQHNLHCVFSKDYAKKVENNEVLKFDLRFFGSHGGALVNQLDELLKPVVPKSSAPELV